MQFFSLALYIVCLYFGTCLAQGESVFQAPATLKISEGEGTSMICNFSTSDSNPNLFWYRQYPNQPPQSIIYVHRYMPDKIKHFGDRFSTVLHFENKTLSLQILAVSLQDSAVYYCALRPRPNTYKIIFGAGTELMIKPDIRNSEPSVYVLQPPKGKASEVNPLCLVTDFSPANETKVVVNEIPQNNSPTLVKTDGQWSYGIVAWSSADECKAKYFNEFYSSEKPKDGAQDVCSTGMISEHFETDEKLNSLSLTVLGLRIIFAKTVVINVLMTLRLWRS